MIVSNRLLSAALSALASQLAADADAALKRYDNVSAYADFASQANVLRTLLSSHGEHLSLTSTRVMLPGEKA